MKTIADGVKQIILEHCPGTFSLYSGYGIVNGEYVRWACGVQLKDKRNQHGRCILAEYQYADGSILKYTYSTTTERYTLTVR